MKSARKIGLLLILLILIPDSISLCAAGRTEGASGWEFRPQPTLPNVLILGDSISIGYTREARRKLVRTANVFRPMQPDGKRPENCGDTRIGLDRIEDWLTAGRWDVIHFNWGLWDLCYRNSESKTQGNRDKVNGAISVPLEEYERNLTRLVERLQKTGAALIWASTTVVPAGEAGRFVGDDEKYNRVAARVMDRFGIPTNDLHALTKGFAGRHSPREGDVHFTTAGCDLLGEQVARAIEASLVARKLRRESE